MSDFLNDSRVIAALVGAVFGLLGGLLSPMLKTFLEERSHKRRIEFEYLRSKQDNLISQQVNLLENLATAWHDLSSMGSQVAFYAITREGFQTEEQAGYFENALQRYQNDGWGMFDKFRQEIRRSKHLVSDEVYEELMECYSELERVDARILHMASAETIEPEYANKLHTEVHREIPKKIDSVIARIASEMGMSATSYALGSQRG